MLLLDPSHKEKSGPSGLNVFAVIHTWCRQVLAAGLHSPPKPGNEAKAGAI